MSNTNTPPSEVLPPCPRCGTESEITQSERYEGDPRVFIRCMGVCDLESPILMKKAAVEWWAHPFNGCLVEDREKVKAKMMAKTDLNDPYSEIYYEKGFDDAWNTRTRPARDDDWTAVEDGLPSEKGDYIVVVDTPYKRLSHWSVFNSEWYIEGEEIGWRVIAWMPIPPYKGDK